MDNIKENINFLKNFVKKRETYIRFSPLGTMIMGLMYILYYFIGENVCSLFSSLGKELCFNNYLFIGIGIFGIIIVTILSLFNSENKGEELLPKSIRYIIINLIFIGIAFFVITLNLADLLQNFIIPLSFLFYGILIIVSRFCIPKYIKYFGFVCFGCGVLVMGPLRNYINEFVLLIFGFGHLIMSVLLKINNDKNG